MSDLFTQAIETPRTKFYPGLVKGYIQYLDTKKGFRERLYAVTETGKVWRTMKVFPMPNNSFYQGLLWEKVDALPEGLTWCGNYPTPAGIC